MLGKGGMGRAVPCYRHETETRSRGQNRISNLEMPEGGLELLRLPCFRKLQTLLTQGTNRTHKNHVLHTLGTHTNDVGQNGIPYSSSTSPPHRGRFAILEL